MRVPMFTPRTAGDRNDAKDQTEGVIQGIIISFKVFQS